MDKFSKFDFWLSWMASEAIVILSLPMLKNIGFFELSVMRGSEVRLLFFILWLAILPLASVVSLYGIHRYTRARWPVVFELGKYGIVGWFNVFLDAGIFNLLILMTGIARGFWANIFYIIAFVITVSQSFFWNKLWIFKSANNGKTKTEYAKFFSVTSATFLLNAFLFHIIVNVVGAPRGIDPKLWANVALAILIPTSVLGNFIGYKILVFGERSFDESENSTVVK